MRSYMCLVELKAYPLGPSLYLCPYVVCTRTSKEGLCEVVPLILAYAIRAKIS